MKNDAKERQLTARECHGKPDCNPGSNCQAEPKCPPGSNCQAEPECHADVTKEEQPSAGQKECTLLVLKTISAAIIIIEQLLSLIMPFIAPHI